MSDRVDATKGGDIEVLGATLHIVPHDSVPRGTIVVVDPASPCGSYTGISLLEVSDGTIKVVGFEQIRQAFEGCQGMMAQAAMAMNQIIKPWVEQARASADEAVRAAIAQSRLMGQQADVQTHHGFGTTPWLTSIGVSSREPTLRGKQAVQWLRTKGLEHLTLATQIQPIHSPWDRQSRKRRKQSARWKQVMRRSPVRTLFV